MIRRNQTKILMACIILTIILACDSKEGALSIIPMDKGTSWVYEGTVEWTVNGKDVKTKNIKWITKIVESVTYPSFKVAVVHGLPQELAWYKEGQNPGCGLLIQKDNKLYTLLFDTEKETLQAFSRCKGTLKEDLLERAQLIVDVPLHAGKRYGGDLKRPDHWYCWYVESEDQRIPMIQGFKQKKGYMLYHLVFRTNPDHQILDFVQGLGIVRYVYEHHGTVASADLCLKEFHAIGEKVDSN